MSQQREPFEAESSHATWKERREPIEAELIHATWTEQREPLPQRERQGGLTAGIILIALGAVFLLAQVFGIDSAILLVLGIGFYVAYFAVSRNRGYLIAGGVLGGLGLGTFVSQEFGLFGPAATGVLFLCWAAGWASIYLIDRTMRWALWPAAVFLIIGAVSAVSSLPGVENLSNYIWPVILIAIGAWLLLRRQRAY